MEFATLRGASCVVELEQAGYEGEAVALTGGGTPFEVEVDGEEFLYTPLRLSTATLRVVGDDYLQSLFSTEYRQWRVTLKRDGVVAWCGFVKPELYTQDYTGGTFELEIECVSAMQVLEHIHYRRKGGSLQFVSLWELLCRCVEESRGRYTEVVLPRVYAAAKGDPSSRNVLEDLWVSEQNFFDEDDEAMTLKEVREEVCKVLGWTCADWAGALYFVDVDHEGAYGRYSPEDGAWKENFLPAAAVNVQQAGFAGGDHTLDMLPGYSRATVKCSNYPVGEVLPQEEWEDLKTLVTMPDRQNGNEVLHMLYLKPRRWIMKQWVKGDNGIFAVADLETQYAGNTNIENLLGAIPVRHCIYTVNNGQPSITDYNYTDAIYLRQSDSVFDAVPDFEQNEVIIIKGECPAIYADGCIALSGSFEYAYGLMTPGGEEPFTALHNTTDHFTASVRVGSKYFDGSGWSEGFKKVDIPLAADGGKGTKRSIKDTKTLQMPYTGAKGFVMPISGVLHGEVEVVLYGIAFDGRSPAARPRPVGIFMEGFSATYYKEEGDGGDESDSDRYYENVVNADYINELDEIELKISSYNNDGACYSKLMLGDAYLTDNLYCVLTDGNVRLEELLIRRIVSRYKQPGMKLTQTLRYAEAFTPITRLTDSYMAGKEFLCAGGTIDFRMDSFRMAMVQVNG